ncbi:hypothetical protein Tco_1441758, partial [Tanacetum coccineum]
MDSGGSYHITYKRDYLFDFEEYDDGNVLLGDGTECRVRETCKVQVQMRDVSSFVLDIVSYVPELRRNLISLGTLKKEGFTVKMQDTIGNGLVEETNLTLLAKVHYFLIQSGLSKFFWAEDTTMSTYLVNRSPSSAIGFKTLVDMLEFFCWLTSYKQWMLEPVKVVLNKNTGFNKSGEYKKTFIGSGVGTGSVQVLQGVEFEVESQEDHAFEVEPHGNIDHVLGSQEEQTQNLIDYHLARDREQHSAHELFRYREDSNEATFAVAAVEKINAHESLIFNDTCTCEVISKWNVGLKEDMDARLNVYVLSNGCKESSDYSNDYYWEYTPGLLDEAKGDILGIEIFRIQSGNTVTFLNF